jgi:outer membrane protein assembly factor BamB/predicted phosphodiesterase
MLKMKKITLIITLFFLFSFNILPQNYKYAWISGIHFELPPVKNELQNIVNDINNKKEISFVLITGDISKSSKNGEIDSAKKILDNLSIPYYIIPGTNDAKLNENCNMEFKDLWKDNKFVFSFKGIKFIGLNNGIFMHESGHYRVEDLQWLDSVLAKTPASEEVFFYSNYPAENRIDNLVEVTNRLNNHNLKAIFFTVQKDNPPANIEGIPVITEISGISDVNGWKYTILENTKDSIIVYNVTGAGAGETAAGFIKNNAVSGMADTVQFKNYTLEPGKNITGIKANVLWQNDLGRTMSAPVITEGNKIFAVTNNGDIFCFDLSGNILWQNKSGERIISRLAASDSIIVAASIEGDLISFNTANGKIIQTIGLNEPITSQLITIDAEYNGAPVTGVVAGTSNGSLYCYDVASFEMIWQNQSAQRSIASEPLFINDRIIYGSGDGHLYCVDAKTGVLNWKLLLSSSANNSPVLCSPVTNEKSVFIAIPGKNISSVDLLLGKSAWQKNNFDAANSIGISDNLGNLYIKCYKDNFLIVSAKNGKIVKNIKIGFGAELSPASILEWNKNIIFSSQNGNIYLIDKDYNWNPLLYLGSGGIQSIIHIKENIFAASTIDGKIIIFNLE